MFEAVTEWPHPFDRLGGARVVPQGETVGGLQTHELVALPEQCGQGVGNSGRTIRGTGQRCRGLAPHIGIRRLDQQQQRPGDLREKVTVPPCSPRMP